MSEDDKTRHSTFVKRQTGLAKKAMELSMMTGSEIGLFVFSGDTQQLFEYCSTDTKEFLQRFCTEAVEPHERRGNHDYSIFEEKMAKGKKKNKIKTRIAQSNARAVSRPFTAVDSRALSQLFSNTNLPHYTTPPPFSSSYSSSAPPPSSSVSSVALPYNPYPYSAFNPAMYLPPPPPPPESTGEYENLGAMMAFRAADEARQRVTDLPKQEQEAGMDASVSTVASAGAVEQAAPTAGPDVQLMQNPFMGSQISDSAPCTPAVLEETMAKRLRAPVSNSCPDTPIYMMGSKAPSWELTLPSPASSFLPRIGSSNEFESLLGSASSQTSLTDQGINFSNLPQPVLKPFEESLKSNGHSGKAPSGEAVYPPPPELSRPPFAHHAVPENGHITAPPLPSLPLLAQPVPLAAMYTSSVLTSILQDPNQMALITQMAEAIKLQSQQNPGPDFNQIMDQFQPPQFQPRLPVPPLPPLPPQSQPLPQLGAYNLPVEGGNWELTDMMQPSASTAQEAAGPHVATPKRGAAGVASKKRSIKSLSKTEETEPESATAPFSALDFQGFQGLSSPSAEPKEPQEGSTSPSTGFAAAKRRRSVGSIEIPISELPQPLSSSVLHPVQPSGFKLPITEPERPSFDLVSPALDVLAHTAFSLSAPNSANPFLQPQPLDSSMITPSFATPSSVSQFLVASPYVSGYSSRPSSVPSSVQNSPAGAKNGDRFSFSSLTRKSPRLQKGGFENLWN